MPPPRFRPPRPSFDYGRLIKGTLKLVWRHKFLWFFGLFAGGSTTSFGGWSSNFDFSPDFSEDTAPTGPSEFSREFSDWVSAHITLIIAALVAVFMLAILAWLWSVVCRGAVIGSVRDIEEEKPSGFGKAFARGRKSFGRLLLFDLFLLALFIGLAIIVTAIIAFFIFMAVMLESAGAAIIAIILVLLGLWIIGMLAVSLGYLTCFSIWFVLWVPVTLLIIYATRAVVIDGFRPTEALRRGWRLMIETLSRTLLLFLLSTGLGIAGSIGAFMVVGLTAIPSIVSWVLTGVGGWPAAGIAISILLSLLPLAMIVLVTALINAYFTAFWTSVYLRLTGREAKTPPPTPAAAFPTAG